MFVLNCRNVNDAYAEGLQLLRNEGQLQPSRAGDVLSLTQPLAVAYAKPQERVLFDVGRDANPFFHLMEALWLLAGRNDAVWLDQFVHDFSERFAEPDGLLHGSYGFRWRKHFDVEGGGREGLPDQLNTVVSLLRVNSSDRRAVISMWDPCADLGANKKDVPCNLIAVPRIRLDRGAKVLDLTVYNRSNDFVWGLTGANAVQFSVLQEYLAARIGVGIGVYNQITTNAHVYLDLLKRLPEPGLVGKYPGVSPICHTPERFDGDLQRFMAWTATDVCKWRPDSLWFEVTFPSNPWFELTAVPVYLAHRLWKAGRAEEALDVIEDNDLGALDWREACMHWLERRIAKAKKKEGLA